MINNKNNNNNNNNKNLIENPIIEDNEDENTILTKSAKKEQSLNFILNSLFYKNSTRYKNNRNNRIKNNNEDDKDYSFQPIKSLIELPDDILLMIFRYLDVPTLLKVSQLCNFLNSVSSNHELWKELFFRKWGPLFPLVPVCTISCCHQYFSNPYSYLEPINQLFSIPFYKSLSIPKSALSTISKTTISIPPPPPSPSPTPIIHNGSGGSIQKQQQPSYTFKQLFKFRNLLFDHYRPIVMDGLNLLKTTISIKDVWMKINDPILSSSINSVTQSRVEKSIITQQPTTYLNINDDSIVNQIQTTFCVKVIKIFPTRILKQLLNLITDYEKIPLWDVSLRHCTGLIVKSPNYKNSKSIISNNSELDPIKKVDILHKQIIGNLYMTYVRMIYSQHDDNLKFFNDTLSGLNHFEDISTPTPISQPQPQQQPQQQTTTTTTTTTSNHHHHNCNISNNQQQQQQQQDQNNQNLKRKREDQENIPNATTSLSDLHQHSGGGGVGSGVNNDDEAMNKEKVLKMSLEFKKRAEENEKRIRQQIMNEVAKKQQLSEATTNAILVTLSSQSVPPSSPPQSTSPTSSSSSSTSSTTTSSSTSTTTTNANANTNTNTTNTSSSSSSRSQSPPVPTKTDAAAAAACCRAHVTSVLDQFDDIRLNHPLYIVQNAIPFKISGDEYVNKYETFKLDCFGSGFIFEPLNEGKETKMTYLLQMGKQDWMEDVCELIDEMAISRNRSLNSLISHSYQLSRRLGTPNNSK
ncbi:hypothetical protein ACTFIW_007947 [Dictyostelium discoideum]